MLLLEKFKTRKLALRTLNFLLFDHWGGLNTMFYILSNNGVVIATKDRNPENICKLIEKYNKNHIAEIERLCSYYNRYTQLYQLLIA